MSLDDIKPKKRKTSIEIEEVDESWALKLLNESEKEDAVITVDTNLKSPASYRKEICLIKNEATPNSDEHSADTFITVDDTVQHSGSEQPDVSFLKLSAIENQILAQSKKQQSQHATDTKKLNMSTSISRIKSFFVA